MRAIPPLPILAALAIVGCCFGPSSPAAPSARAPSEGETRIAALRPRLASLAAPSTAAASGPALPRCEPIPAGSLPVIEDELVQALARHPHDDLATLLTPRMGAPHAIREVGGYGAPIGSLTPEERAELESLERATRIAVIRASDYVAPVIPESGSVFVTGRYVGSATVLEVATAAPVCSVPFAAINTDQAEPNHLVQDLLQNAISSATRALAAPPAPEEAAGGPEPDRARAASPSRSPRPPAAAPQPQPRAAPRPPPRASEAPFD